MISWRIKLVALSTLNLASHYHPIAIIQTIYFNLYGYPKEYL